MSRQVKAGSTDQTFYVMMVDSAAGTPETGLTVTGIDLTYVRDGAAAVKNDATALAAVDSAHGDNKAFEVDGTNAPGLYRVDFPDAAFAASVAAVQLVVTCTGCAPAVLEVELPTAIASDTLSADVVSISGDSGAADNLELDYDGTGYAKANSTIGTCTANTDMVGTDSAATAANLATAQTDLDTLTGTDGVTLATTQPNYAPATASALTTHDGKLDTVDGIVDAIVADTNELQTDWADGGRLDLLLDAVITDAAMAELAADPGATPTLREALMLLYMEKKNDSATTTTSRALKNDAGASVLTSTMSDNGTTFSKGKLT